MQQSVKIPILGPEIKLYLGAINQRNIEEMLTYKRNAGSQQQDPDKQVLELLHNQLPDALACEKKTKEW